MNHQRSFSPFMTFPRSAWREHRAHEVLTLSEGEIERLRGFNEKLCLNEVQEIYLPLSRLLNLYVDKSKALHRVSCEFLGSTERKVPYIIGVCGSVAVGKSTTSRILQALLSRWGSSPRVALVSTDSFLYSNAELAARGLIERKGFPESFELKKLLEFLFNLKSGLGGLQVPVYSHQYYDRLPGEFLTIDHPDILILEGLNVLQKRPSIAGAAKAFVADFLDFTIFVDAEIPIIEQWYVERFMAFRAQAKTRPELFFHQFSKMDADSARAHAASVWRRINEANLVQHILPDRFQARLILTKDRDHSVSSVSLRKV